jgi:hypothetical protein
MTDTPETDTLYNPENGWTGVVPIDYARRLERERDNALSDWRQADTDSIRALHERNEAREQRDRLAEALRDIANGTNCQECGGEDQARFACEALQSLINQPR